MKRKVIDVLPPQAPKVEAREEETVKVKPKNIRSKKGKRLILSLAIFILLSVVGYFSLAKVEIVLWPETETLEIEMVLNVQEKIGSKVDLLAETIPGQAFQKEKTLQETFTSSGVVLKEEKAKGKIKVYNAYSTEAQVLIATTRFINKDEKLFRTPVAVTIPGGHYEGKKLIPGEVEIEVVADQPGAEYNIGPTSFSIPGFAGTDKFTKFYAESTGSMSGGLKEEKAVVTKEDLVRAESITIKKTQEDCMRLLSEGLQAEAVATKFNYPTEGYKFEILEKLSLSAVEEETAEFKYQVKGICRTLLFAAEDLDTFVKELVAKEIKSGYEVYEESIKVDYQFTEIDLESNSAKLKLKVKATIYPEIKREELKRALVGKSLLETKLFLENQLAVYKVNVSFWPFWVRRIPDKFNKVHILINIDK